MKIIDYLKLLLLILFCKAEFAHNNTTKFILHKQNGRILWDSYTYKINLNWSEANDI